MVSTNCILETIIAGYILIFGLFSLFIKEQLLLSEALLSLLGIVCGEKGFGWIHLDRTFLEEASRFVIVIQLMAVGISLPKRYFRDGSLSVHYGSEKNTARWHSLAFILGPVTLAMWIVSSLLIYLIFTRQFELGIYDCMMLGACITPTDPILASSILRGRFADLHIPVHVRNLLAVESGANDSLALPIFYLSYYLKLSTKSNPIVEESKSLFYLLWQWTYWIIGYQIFGSALLGLLYGYLARIALRYCQDNNLIDKESFLVFSLALSVHVMGFARLIKANEMVAVFLASIVFAWNQNGNQDISLGNHHRKNSITLHMNSHDNNLQDVADMVFSMSFFIYLGAILPWDQFSAIGYGSLLPWALLVLLFRRLPIVLLLGPTFIPIIKKSKREAFFLGWFGPIGVGAIFYCCSVEVFPEIGGGISWNEVIFPIVSFMVLSSTIVHGMTVPLFHLTFTRVRTLSIAAMMIAKRQTSYYQDPTDAFFSSRFNVDQNTTSIIEVTEGMRRSSDISTAGDERENNEDAEEQEDEELQVLLKD